MTEPVTDEVLLLDLLNSTPVVDGIPRDLLGPSWLSERGGHGSGVEQTRTARRLLQDVVRGRAAAASLTPVLDGVHSVPVIEDSRVAWAMQVAAHRRLAVRAVLAWDELQRVHPGRLRPCANPECALFLVDHSKPNRARWCSMAACGNRMKARRHYERTRSANDTR